jgi:hypothetical protein
LDRGNFLWLQQFERVDFDFSLKPPPLGKTISLDTKHIIAWVKENSHKAYVPERNNKDKQSKEDPDYRLGCKRNRNQGVPSSDNHATPLKNPVLANRVTIGEFY